MAIDDKTLERIKKCFALAGSSEPHEAALALQRAQELMKAAGVTAEEVEVGPLGQEELRSVASAAKLKGWELRLFDAVADAFGCGLLFRRGIKPETLAAHGLPDKFRYGVYTFLGPKRDAQVALYAAQVLQRQLQRARVEFTGTLPFHWPKQLKTREVDAFCTGWVYAATKKVEPLVSSEARKRIIERAIAEEAKAEPPPVNDKSSKGSRAALRAGYAEGEHAQLHRPMAETTTNSAGALPARKREA